eukprot:TRINITY_DN48298_c0_g1_i1.p1 TRINITY_DN48298_c0_g1~~TRINITY_DN48298_c0_g1_i1.p1  ORF type:complete len:157 (+),score=25.20 TRINITY_DN48298_c0_g1_i1:226-696(+)
MQDQLEQPTQLVLQSEDEGATLQDKLRAFARAWSHLFFSADGYDGANQECVAGIGAPLEAAVCDKFCEGDMAQGKGFTKNPERNGMVDKIIDCDEDDDLWRVELFDGDMYKARWARGKNTQRVEWRGRPGSAAVNARQTWWCRGLSESTGYGVAIG